MVVFKEEDLHYLITLIVQNAVLGTLVTSDVEKNEVNHHLDLRVFIHSTHAKISVVIAPGDEAYAVFKQNLSDLITGTHTRFCLSPMEIRNQMQNCQICEFIVTFTDIQIVK